ncbi:two-component system response regulator [Pseudodesulfovibrio nedwellii]|uniref:Two-component system response regulator n=1 Tax=Pseudodesulfovibrio nedwellii TaxID=2973072 RepID=A0ABN6S367_9BACT|nr:MULTISPECIES: response regulator [Pseudodesulfovibrio]BDQ36752.1 two-component system response regulator [Pseudodesulfovibrio nedwellii]
MKALIVDDDFYSRNMIHEILRQVAQCDIAVNGEEAIEAFGRGLAHGEPYNLICLDLLMPEMDGQQALREIRALEKEHDVAPQDESKVIVTTMLADEKETHDAFFLGGATSYLVKPIDEEKLLNEIKSLGLL